MCLFAVWDYLSELVVLYSGNVWQGENLMSLANEHNFIKLKAIQISHAPYKTITLYTILPNYLSNQFPQTVSLPNIPAIWYSKNAIVKYSNIQTQLQLDTGPHLFTNEL